MLGHAIKMMPWVMIVYRTCRQKLLTCQSIMFFVFFGERDIPKINSMSAQCKTAVSIISITTFPLTFKVHLGLMNKARKSSMLPQV